MEASNAGVIVGSWKNNPNVSQSSLALFTRNCGYLVDALVDKRSQEFNYPHSCGLT